MANHVTSANSPTPYRDDLFGPWFATSLFVSEPVHNLVHRMVLEPDGATFRGQRGPNESGREFLASSDNWFRPTMLKTGPDGALWIADMYRAVIEHPEWIPDDWEKRLDLRAGSEQGRIYRVYPVDTKPRPIPRLDRLDTAGLVAALDSPSGWQRDTAQRLLLHRGDPEAFAPLRALAPSTKRPKTRVQAIWTLADLDGLDEPSALAGLTDPNPESARARSRPPAAASRRPERGRCRFPARRRRRTPMSGSRSRWPWETGTTIAAGEALARLARVDGNDPWMRAAILSSAVPHVATLLLGILFADEAGGAAAQGDGRAAAGARRSPAGRQLERIRGPHDRQARGAGGALCSLAVRRARRACSSPRPGQEAASLDLDRPFAGLWDRPRGLVHGRRRPPKPPGSRPCGSWVTPRRGMPADRDLLVGLLAASGSIELQQAAVAALGRTTDPKVADLLLARLEDVLSSGSRRDS